MGPETDRNPAVDLVVGASARPTRRFPTSLCLCPSRIAPPTRPPSRPRLTIHLTAAIRLTARPAAQTATPPPILFPLSRRLQRQAVPERGRPERGRPDRGRQDRGRQDRGRPETARAQAPLLLATLLPAPPLPAPARPGARPLQKMKVLKAASPPVRSRRPRPATR
jgi:hypothetical protein